MKRFLKIVIWFFSGAVFCSVCAAALVWYLWSNNLPYIDPLRDYRPPIITEVYADDGQRIGQFWEERRMLVPLSEVSPHLIDAFVAAVGNGYYAERWGLTKEYPVFAAEAAAAAGYC